MANPGAMEVLRNKPIICGLPGDVLLRLVNLSRNRDYRRGQVVFTEGTPGTRLFGIISGRLLITTASPLGEELHLNVVGPGEILGEIAFLDGAVRTATGRAAEPTTCFEIERAPFIRLLENSPQLSTHLLRLVCKRVRWMTRLVADSAFLSVPERLAARLNDLVELDRRTEVRISQNDLACFLGISRQAVNGYLRAWERAGYIELARGAIRVKDLSALH
jgi:CRP/FNR family transcriptional regulator, cyclic AMP receptor protein